MSDLSCPLDATVPKAKTAVEESSAIARLQEEVALRRKQERDQSCIAYLTGKVYNLIGNGGQDPLKTLEQARTAGATDTEIKALVARDRQNLENEHTLSSYSSGFLKTSSLFLRGKAPIAMAVYALDQIRPHESLAHQFADGCLGLSKGALTKASFKLAEPIKNHAAKGVALGSISRLVDLGLSRQTYQDRASGTSSFKTGLNLLLSSTLNKEAAIADASVFALAGCLSLSANKITGDALRRSALASTICTGTTFGLTTGALEEINRQQQSGQQFDLREVVKKSLIKGALDGIAACPGGMQAARAASLPADVEPRRQKNLQTQFRPARKLLEATASDTIGGARLELALSERQTGAKLNEVGRRLSEPITGERQFREPTGVSIEECIDEADFLERGLSWTPRKVRIYEIDQDTRIVIPEDYAQKLDKVRSFRRAMESNPSLDRAELAKLHLGTDKDLANRSLPEDFISAIDRLPDKTLISLTLLNEPNPEDPAHRRRLNDPFFRSAATSAQDGEICFYEHEVDSSMELDVSHEWAHVLKYRLPSLSKQFDHAALVEKNGYMQRPYADTKESENWAVHLGEQVLHPKDSEFGTFLSSAPVRAVILGRALQQSLNDAEASGRVCTEHDLWTARSQKLQSRLPDAQRFLIDTISTSKDAATRNAAVKLLVQLGEPEQLQRLTELRQIDLQGEPITDNMLKKISGMTQLTELDLADTLLTKHGTSNLQALTALQRLDLSKTNTSNSSLDYLQVLKGLRVLNLSGTEVGDSGVIALTPLNNLQLLDLRGTKVTKLGIQTLQNRLPQLKILANR